MIKEAYLVQLIQVKWGLEYCYMTILCKCNSVLLCGYVEWDILVSKYSYLMSEQLVPLLMCGKVWLARICLRCDGQAESCTDKVGVAHLSMLCGGSVVVHVGFMLLHVPPTH